jgi:hypothetical protein
MSYNMMIGYDIYDCFTMEHFLLYQSMIQAYFTFFNSTLTVLPEIPCLELYKEDREINVCSMSVCVSVAQF